MEILKSSSNLTIIYHSLEKKHEEYSITGHLTELAKAKYEARTPAEAFEALASEQKYLANLNGKLQDPDYKNSSLAGSIKYAHRNEKENIFGQL